MAAVVEQTELEILVAKLQELRQWHAEALVRPTSSKDQGSKYMVSYY